MDLLGPAAFLAEFAGKVPLRCLKVSSETGQPVSGQGHLLKLQALSIVETFGLLSSRKGPRFWEVHPRGELLFVVLSSTWWRSNPFSPSEGTGSDSSQAW